MLKQFTSTVINNRSWLLLATFFFIGGTFLMYGALTNQPELMAMIEETTFPLLQELGEQVFGGHPLRGVALLFVNNTFASIQVILLGLLLGIAPLFSAIANGAIMGALAFQLAQEGIGPLPFLLAGILPHGILELPAFLLSVAFGLKLGYHIVFPAPGQRRRETLAGIFREIAGVMPVIILLLLAAAFIEVYITPNILLRFVTP